MHISALPLLVLKPNIKLVMVHIIVIITELEEIAGFVKIFCVKIHALEILISRMGSSGTTSNVMSSVWIFI